ncbi:MAG: hypothetical protein CMC18_08560 [Flavobacteriaceae bacterium]|nr:hypothetical protein [Flavobacteriaceae bacterium]
MRKDYLQNLMSEVFSFAMNLKMTTFYMRKREFETIRLVNDIFLLFYPGTKEEENNFRISKIGSRGSVNLMLYDNTENWYNSIKALELH